MVQFRYEYRGPPPAHPAPEVAAEVAIFGSSTSAPIRVNPGKSVDLEIRLDPGEYVSVRADTRYVMSAFLPVADAPARLGNGQRADLPAFAGTAQFLPVVTPVCDRLVRLAHRTPTRPHS
jgi:hypothetical protein